MGLPSSNEKISSPVLISRMYTRPSLEQANTFLSSTTGDASTLPWVLNDHNFLPFVTSRQCTLWSRAPIITLLFITEGELNLLILKELGYPVISIPSISQLTDIDTHRLEAIEHLFLLAPNTPEAQLAAREFAVRVVSGRIGFIEIALRTGLRVAAVETLLR